MHFIHDMCHEKKDLFGVQNIVIHELFKFEDLNTAHFEPQRDLFSCDTCHITIKTVPCIVIDNSLLTFCLVGDARMPLITVLTVLTVLTDLITVTTPK